MLRAWLSVQYQTFSNRALASYSLSSTFKVFPSICTILFPIAYRQSPVACLPNVILLWWICTILLPIAHRQSPVACLPNVILLWWICTILLPIAHRQSPVACLPNVILLWWICTILFPIAYRQSPVACIPNVRSFCGGGEVLLSLQSSIFSAACLVALTIGWKMVCSSSPIASFISRFTILRRRTVSLVLHTGRLEPFVSLDPLYQERHAVAVATVATVSLPNWYNDGLLAHVYTHCILPVVFLFSNIITFIP